MLGVEHLSGIGDTLHTFERDHGGRRESILGRLVLRMVNRISSESIIVTRSTSGCGIFMTGSSSPAARDRCQRRINRRALRSIRSSLSHIGGATTRASSTIRVQDVANTSAVATSTPATARDAVSMDGNLSVREVPCTGHVKRDARPGRRLGDDIVAH